MTRAIFRASVRVINAEYFSFPGGLRELGFVLQLNFVSLFFFLCACGQRSFLHSTYICPSALLNLKEEKKDGHGGWYCWHGRWAWQSRNSDTAVLQVLKQSTVK